MNISSFTMRAPCSNTSLELIMSEKKVGCWLCCGNISAALNKVVCSGKLHHPMAHN